MSQLDVTAKKLVWCFVTELTIAVLLILLMVAVARSGEVPPQAPSVPDKSEAPYMNNLPPQAPPVLNVPKVQPTKEVENRKVSTERTNKAKKSQCQCSSGCCCGCQQGEPCTCERGVVTPTQGGLSTEVSEYRGATNGVPRSTQAGWGMASPAPYYQPSYYLPQPAYYQPQSVRSSGNEYWQGRTSGNEYWRYNAQVYQPQTGGRSPRRGGSC